MPKLGRPFVYQADEDRPVTISLRVPGALHAALTAHAARHRRTLTELVLEGIELRLATPADPRDLILSDDNTVIQELQTMIDQAVQAALARQSAPAQAEPLAPAPLAAARQDASSAVPEGMRQCKRGHTPYPRRLHDCPVCNAERQRQRRRQG